MACLSHAFLMLMFSCQTASVESDTLIQVLQQNNRAMGGSPAWEQVENLRIQLHIHEPTYTVTGTYLASRELGMRIDVEAEGKRVFAEGLHQGAAWQWTPDDGYRPFNEAGTAALRHGIEGPGKFYTLQQFRDRGGQVALSKPALLAKSNEWQLQITLSDGQVIYHFLDRDTYLPTREITRRAFHPDVNPTPATIESRFSDPMKIDGVIRFRTIESRDLISGELLGTTVIQAVEHNVSLPADSFAAESPLLTVRGR